MYQYNRSQQWPSPQHFISKIGRKIYRKKWCLKALILTRSTIHVEHFNVFSWFCALSREGIASVQINFFYINKQLTWLMNFCFLWVILEKSVCPTHTLKASLIFLVYGQIFPNFACRGQIKKTSNFDPIFGIKTNRICSSVIPPPLPLIGQL